MWRRVAALRRALHHVSGVAGDLADRQLISQIARQVGEVDVLVNNAGIYEEELLGDVSAASWSRSMAVNITAPFLLARHFLAGLKDRRGVIVNVASDAAQLGVAGASTYCASKGAMVGLTKALAIELAPHVRAICVCPGPVATDMMRRQVEAAPDSSAAEAQWNSFAPLKRVARPAEIASLVAFAASREAGFATGSIWMMDGGLTAGKIP
jgi:NAD(P)-dependent dehydrogenase (short-subunit alcohol dehydrogenase family)